MKKAVFQNMENRMVTGDPGQNRTGDLPLRSSINQSLSLYNIITLKQLKALI